MPASVLLIAPDPAASSVADALRAGVPAEVHLGQPNRESLSMLHREDFSLILLDENIAARDPAAAEALHIGAGSAPVLELNLAICSAARVVREVRGALHRRQQDEKKARVAAAARLGNELNASLAGLVLESQLALRQAGPELARTLQGILTLVAELRN